MTVRKRAADRRTPAEPDTAAPPPGEEIGRVDGAAGLRELPRHRHHLSRDAVRASQTTRLLIATAETVAEKGYAATTVADIIQRAGVSRKTFYELYADKEEAFVAAYRSIDLTIGRMTAAVSEHVATDPHQMLRAGVRSYLESLAQQPALTRMFVIEAVGAGPRVLELRAKTFRKFIAVFVKMLQLLRAADPSIPEPDELELMVLLGGINELVLDHLVRREAKTLVELAPVVERLAGMVCLRPRSD